MHRSICVGVTFDLYSGRPPAEPWHATAAREGRVHDCRRMSSPPRGLSHQAVNAHLPTVNRQQRTWFSGPRIRRRGFCRSGRGASLAAPDPASPRAHPRIATREGEPDRATLDGVGPRAEHVRLLFLSAILPNDVDQQAAFQGPQGEDALEPDAAPLTAAQLVRVDRGGRSGAPDETGAARSTRATPARQADTEGPGTRANGRAR
jgi:hypothetical protein